jgi:hypothetical protein
VSFVFYKSCLSETDTDRLSILDQKYCKSVYALVVYKRSQLSYSYLKTVLDSGKEFEADFKRTDQIDNLRSYI